MGPFLIAAALAFQDPGPLARQAEAAIRDIEEGRSPDGEALQNLFRGGYVMSPEWEPGLVPALIAGLKSDQRLTQQCAWGAFTRVTGIGLFREFAAFFREDQLNLLRQIDAWALQTLGGVELPMFGSAAPETPPQPAAASGAGEAR